MGLDDVRELAGQANQELQKFHFYMASTCNKSWNDMHGNEKKRLCHSCDRFVYNISKMTQAEVETLLHTAIAERVCVKLYKRADGTVITKDCPIGVRMQRAIKYGYFLAALVFSGCIWIAFNIAQSMLRTSLSQAFSTVVSPLGVLSASPVPDTSILMEPSETTALPLKSSRHDKHKRQLR